MRPRLDRLGTLGALLAALACPVCFPKIALVGAALGLGALAPFEDWFAAAAQVFLVIAGLGHLVAYRQHHMLIVPVLGWVGVLLVLGALWLRYVETIVYAGLTVLVVATVWSIVAVRRGKAAGVASIRHEA
jgi:mercuric ion transport protein